MNPNAIREGTDVYFDCLIVAEPPVYKVEWRHQVSGDLVSFANVILFCIVLMIIYVLFRVFEPSPFEFHIE